MIRVDPIADGSSDLTEQLYPNQFIMGPAFLNGLSRWKKIRVNENLFLTAHPNLDVLSVNNHDKSLFLIGYILDGRRPASDNEQILSDLLGGFDRFDGFYEKTYCYGGRWVMLALDGDNAYLFNDAAGHRQVFYTAADAGPGPWCASQPRLLADVIGCSISQAAGEFIDSYEFRKNVEYRWPGHGSPYTEIMHLLPNHYLDLGSGASKRYWPARPLTQTTLEHAVEVVSSTLKGLVEAAACRFELAVSLTAGLDSRAVLAASRNVVADNPVMTVRQIDKPEDHADIDVAARLALELGFHHDVIHSSLIISDEFLRCFKQNTALPHYIYAPDAHAIGKYYQHKRVAVTGSISEIGRLSFRAQLGKPESEPIDAYDLSRLQKMGKQPYAVNAFDAWLAGTGNTYNIPILDLFEWEQGHGNWLAMCHMEFDIAWKDIFAPFNCRDLLTTLLSVDSRYRKKPDNTLYRAMINSLWPEILDVPINPHDNHKRKLTAVLRSGIPYPIKKSIKRFLGR